MKRWLSSLILFAGVSVMVVMIWLGTNEGIAADAEGRGGNGIPFIIGTVLGLVIAIVGLIGFLTALTERKTGSEQGPQHRT
ncbi:MULTISPECIES: hypothetical protein [unclassified Microbacterium]|uniref:hypothetical protein n=1 Tax=unclassified Microbacterium TaxID=2609290 RepID=UPI000CFB32A8|nr:MULTISPECIES: hypothetical protein [unclassified Microbacterium]PQZ48524.1 hypothetical protein CQ032_20180 [Microbacterium sp. MYb43]PQZ69247.1 hypothetical protein CQ031_20130 [Microbacterium sp. MYb40]PRB13967.1 hypothetical protein CQ040_20185 [Microbacterium sp. MYb54]PRB20056.1 hypothetical protein CQ037_20125 [Microbacterium sp. MYb50]PRB57795.1 hypothetical protein CQ021_20160 [Microbacterium sp. MYb24]